MSATAVSDIQFSQKLVDFIEEWRDKPGNLVMVLHQVQEEFGFIPREAAIKVSEMIGEPLARIYGVITFYQFFKLTKPGKHNIKICMGTACYLKQADDLLKELENILGVPVNVVTEDGLYSVEAVRCVGCCGLAPLAVIDGDVYGKLTPDDLPELIAKYRD